MNKSIIWVNVTASVLVSLGAFNVPVGASEHDNSAKNKTAEKEVSSPVSSDQALKNLNLAKYPNLPGVAPCHKRPFFSNHGNLK